MNEIFLQGFLCKAPVYRKTPLGREIADVLLAISFGVSPVYPRWRGELSVFGITFGFGCGLSPLARGTLRERIAARLRKRFIPAGAGNSLKVYICS